MSIERKLQQRLDFLKYDGQCAQTLKELKSVLDPALGGLLDEFYVHLKNNPTTAEYFPNADVVQRARNAQLRHWLDLLFSGEHGKTYFEQAVQIGVTHERIGLSLSDYLGGYCFMLNRFVDRIVGHYQGDPVALADKLKAVNKAVFFDMDCVIDSYLDTKNAALRKILQNAEQFANAVEEVDEEVAIHGHRLEPHAEKLADGVRRCQSRLEALHDASAGSLSEDARELLLSLKDDLRQCAEEATVVSGRARQLSRRLDDLARAVKGRREQHKLHFSGMPSEGLKARLGRMMARLFR